MKTKAEIQASNQNLISYRVMLHEDKGDKFQITFDCYAENDDHAAEQAKNSYPNGEVLTTTPFSGNDDAVAADEKRKFFKTTYTIVVLSEDHPVTNMSLEDLSYEIEDGECSGVVTSDAGIELTPSQMAKALTAQGSSPDFFQLSNANMDEAVEIATPQQAIDWSLLRHQKSTLVAMANDDDRLTTEIESLDGIIALIDSLQDEAVKQGKATEVEVFGVVFVIYSPNESATSDDGAGFWNNEDGWTILAGATKFSESDKDSLIHSKCHGTRRPMGS